MMHKGLRISVLSFLFVFVISLGTVQCASSDITGDLLFSTDFANDSIGALPSGFKTEASTQYVKVIADKTAIGGKALQILADPENVLNLVIDEIGTDASIVAVEFAVRYPKGHAVNFHLWGVPEMPESWACWFIDARTNPYLGYRYTDPNGTTRTLFINHLDAGWNKVTVIVDSSTDEAILGLVNESQEMSDGPLPMRAPVSSWKSMGFRIECTWREPLNEVYFDYIKIWAIK
jgi:hypothetical protein